MNNKKIEEIQNRIDKYKQRTKKAKKTEKGKQASSAFTNLAFNIAIELVSGMFVGLTIGALLDKLFASGPLFFIICFMLAMIATFRLIWNKYIRNNGA